jgi:PilZ domain-containing protein
VLRLGALDFVRKPVSIDVFRHVLFYAELQAIRARLDAVERLGDRRRSLRSKVVLPVTVIGDDGTAWQGTAVDLSAFGIKIAPPSESVGPGPTAWLSIAVPGEPALDLLGVLIGRDPEGYRFRFVNLKGSEFQRLRDFVERLLTEPS